MPKQIIDYQSWFNNIITTRKAPKHITMEILPFKMPYNAIYFQRILTELQKLGKMCYITLQRVTQKSETGYETFYRGKKVHIYLQYATCFSDELDHFRLQPGQSHSSKLMNKILKRFNIYT